jgi:aryl-alcohol dehydrogenase-like predicted oxidoreductase
VAQAKGCTLSQVALAWVLSRGDDVVPIPGTKRRQYLEENVGAVALTLVRPTSPGSRAVFRPVSRRASVTPKPSLRRSASDHPSRVARGRFMT